MTGIPWDPALETGDITIDAQHRTLFSLVNQLRDAAVEGRANEAVSEVLGRLVLYVETHFAEEQQLMLNHGYPVDELVAHVEAHTALSARTSDIVEQHRRGELTTILPLTEFLVEWLRTHIRQVDRRFVDYVRAQEA